MPTLPASIKNGHAVFASVTPREWEHLALAHTSPAAVALTLGIVMEDVEQALAAAETRIEKRRHIAASEGGHTLMTPILERPDLPRHLYRRVGL